MLKAIIFFPFRLVFGLPWWMLAPFAIWLGVVLAQAIPAAYERYIDFKVAYVFGPVPLRTLQDFDRTRDVSDFGEVNISATYQSQYRPMLLEVSGLDMIAVPLFAKGQTTRIAAVAYAFSHQEDDLVAFLQAQGTGGIHSVDLNGTVDLFGPIVDQARFVFAGNGLQGAQDMIAIRPFLSGRGAGLSEPQYGQWLLLGVGTLLFLVTAVAALRNFGRKRPTRAALPAAKPVSARRTSKVPSQKPAPAASPWGGLAPPPDAPVPPPLPEGPAADFLPKDQPEVPPAVRRVSSGYRAKTAEEIVREVFGPREKR